MKQKLIIISGERGEGKTTFLANIVKQLKIEGKKLGGILALGFWREGVRDSFEIVNLSNDTRAIYCQRNPVEGWEKIVHFYINPKGDEFGNKALQIEVLQNVDWIIIDEVGPFELQGKGWAKAIDRIVKELDIPMIWVVRNSLVQEVLIHWNIEQCSIANIKKHTVDDVIDWI